MDTSLPPSHSHFRTLFDFSFNYLPKPDVPISPTLLPSPALALRITFSDESYQQTLIKFLTELKLPVIAALEEADEQVSRTHAHTIIFTTFNAEQLRNRFKAKSYFPDITKTDYAITTIKNTPEDLAAMFRYTVKGIHEVGPNILFSSFTRELVWEQHLEYWARQLEFQANVQKQKETAPVKKVRERSKTWLEQITHEAMREVEFEDIRDRRSIVNLTEFVLYHMGKNTVKKLGRKIIQELVMGIANALMVRKASQSTVRQNSYKEYVEVVGNQVHEDIMSSMGYI